MAVILLPPGYIMGQFDWQSKTLRGAVGHQTLSTAFWTHS